MNWRILPVRMLWFGLLLVVGLGVTFYLALGRVAKLSITQQLLVKEQTIARAEASNITTFFQVFGDSIAILAQLRSITSPNSAIWDLDVFVEQWRESNLVGGVVLTDRNGVVRFNSNVLGTKEVGESLADRDYFVWAKNEAREEGVYFVGQPVISQTGATKGQTIVPVAAPVFQNGLFTGVIASSVKLNPLSQRFLGLMKVSNRTDIYLIDQSGNLLYSNSATDAIGLNIFEVLKEGQFTGSQSLIDNIKNALGTTEEGKSQTTYLNPKTNKVETRLTAYSPILLGNQNWLLITASPTHDVLNFTTLIYVRLAIILLLVFLSILLFGVVTSREIEHKLK